MQLPKENASYIRVVSFGYYSVGKLTRKKQDDLAASVKSSSQNILSLGRTWDDAALATQQGYADRDAVDEDADSVARRIRQLLANRSLDAERQAPYTKIFPDGVGYYTEAPVSEEVQRYQLLVSRLEANLPEDDAVRTEFVPQLKALIQSFSDAETALEVLVNAETIARDQLSAAHTDWDKLMNDTYSTLCQRYDKKKAELFFRRPQKRDGETA